MERSNATRSCGRSERGIAMVALLVTLSAMGIMLSVALPAWQTAARREKEAELVFRGEQYAAAIARYQRKYANSSPPTVDVLVTERFLRKKYRDPMTDGDFEYLTAGSAIQGSTTSTSVQGRAAAAAAQGRSAGLSFTHTTIGATAGSRGAQPQTGAGRATAQGARAGGGFQVQSSFSVGSTTGGATTGIIGVRSKSKEKSFRVYNGAESYDQWIFLATQAASAVSAPVGGLAPGTTGGRGQTGGRGGQAPGAGGRAQPQGVRGRGDAPAPQRGGGPVRGGAGGAGGGFGGGGGGRGF